MDLSGNKKLALLFHMKGRKKLSHSPVSMDFIKKIQSEITMVNTHEAGLFFQMRTNDTSIQSNWSKLIAKPTPINFIACVADLHYPDCSERAGYFAHQIATVINEIGLESYFVGDSFNINKTDIRVRPGENFLFSIIFGNPIEQAHDIISDSTGVSEKMKENAIKKILSGDRMLFNEASKIIPDFDSAIIGMSASADTLNKASVRLRNSSDSDSLSLIAGVDSSTDKELIELGISKHSFTYITGVEWEWGNNSVAYID